MAMFPYERVSGTGHQITDAPRCSLRQISINDDLHNTVEQSSLFR